MMPGTNTEPGRPACRSHVRQSKPAEKVSGGLTENGALNVSCALCHRHQHLPTRVNRTLMPGRMAFRLMHLGLGFED
jgi:hypothetical protein